jgi:hypothetical protein
MKWDYSRTAGIVRLNAKHYFSRIYSERKDDDQ